MADQMKLARNPPVFMFAFLLICISTSGVSAQEQAVVSDTDLHILAGIIASFGTASLLIYTSAGDEPDTAELMITAGAATVGAGIAKEIIDSFGFGTSEIRDVVNTLLGGAIGVSAVIFSLSAFPEERTTAHKNLLCAFLSMPVVLSIPLIEYVFRKYGERRS